MQISAARPYRPTRTTPRAAVVLVATLGLVGAAAPATASYSRPRPVTPDGSNASFQAMATDHRGDTTFAWLADHQVRVRVLRADGSRTPVRTAGTLAGAISLLRVAVDDDGDGVVVWDDIDTGGSVPTPLHARRVTRAGRLGTAREVAPSGHDVRDAQVAVQPRGRAVITWVRLADASGYTPWVRTLGVNGALGRPHRIGRGPSTTCPAVDVDRSGRALLAWGHAAKIFVRRLSRSGALGSTVRIHRAADPADGLGPVHVSVDRDGDALVTWLRQNDYDNEAWGRRVDRSLKPLGRSRILSRKGQLAVEVESDTDLQGDSVVTWHVNYFAGVFARRIRRDGTVGPVEKLGKGGLGGVALDGDGDGAIAWSGYRDGLRKLIRVTRVRRGGGFGRTVTVGVNGYDTSRITLGATPAGRVTVAWEEEPYDGAHIMAVRGH